MKNVKINHFIFLIVLLALYVGLFVAVDSLWVKGISLILLLAALLIKDTYYWHFIFTTFLAFATMMTYYSFKEIPGWAARVSDDHVGTDTVWGRDVGYVDVLMFTILQGKKCIVEEEGWYNKYIEAMSTDTLTISEIDREILSSETALTNGFEEVGWMHIDNNFNLLSDEANARFEEGKRVYFYINPTGLSEADTIVIWNDMKGNIYIEAYEAGNQ